MYKGGGGGGGQLLGLHVCDPAQKSLSEKGSTIKERIYSSSTLKGKNLLSTHQSNFPFTVDSFSKVYTKRKEFAPLFLYPNPLCLCMCVCVCVGGVGRVVYHFHICLYVRPTITFWS